jgi:hypothetical protein
MLRTLHDAGHYAAALPKQDRVEWQTAAEMLIPAAQGQGRSCSPRLPCGRRCTLKHRGQAPGAAAEAAKEIQDHPMNVLPPPPVHGQSSEIPIRL